MGSYQGFIARKLLVEIDQAMAAADASSPSPFLNEDGSYLSSPFNSNPETKPITAITIAFIIVTFFLVGFLSAHFRCCYARSSHLQAALYNRPAQGLDASILETLPKVIFSCAQSQRKEIKKKEKATMECAICLEEFSEQETLRLIPQCGHTFHLECINMWFFSHTTCPLCRHSLLPHPDTVAVAAVNSPSDAAMARNSIAIEITLQVRATENPKKPKNPRNPSEEEGEEGESSGNRVELRRSNSTGHGLVNKGRFLLASSSPPLLSFVVHRSSSCTVLSDLWKTSAPA